MMRIFRLRERGTTVWTEVLASYRQVTDAHLLSLALRRGGVLATLDRGLVELAGPDGRDAVEAIRFKGRVGE